MARLRVRGPDTLTRVTEYVPEIVEFVEQIVKNGYAYEFEGSVYFDTQAFDKADGHDYAKLEPWSKGNRELLEEGEGRASFIFRDYFTYNNCEYTRLSLSKDWSSISFRLRTLESVQAWGTLLAIIVGCRAPRLAHRMLGYG